MKKRLLSILLTICMVVILAPTVLAADADTSDGISNTSWYNDTNNDFTITTAEQLAGLAELVNNGTSFEGKTVKLGADIDLSGVEWTPIGGYNASASFNGTFDGDNYTISNMTITKTDDANATLRLGLFSNVTNATIQNLTLKDSKITAESSNACASVLVMTVNTSGTISNVTVDGAEVNVTSGETGYAAGVVGYTNKINMSGITVKNVELNAKANAVRASAIAAYHSQADSDSTTLDSFVIEDVKINAEAVNGGTYIGGAFGLCQKGNQNTVGLGITNGTVDGLTIVSNATGEGDVGGLIGYTYKVDPLKVEDVAITNLDIDFTGASSKVGGVTGREQSVSRTTGGYTDVSVAGTITENATSNSGSEVGGFVGISYYYPKTYSNCSADVDITTTNRAGGFVGTPCPNGWANQTDLYSNCTASGDVTAPVAGGFVGCAWLNNGVNSTLKLENVTATGVVNGSTHAGGLIGGAFGSGGCSNIIIKDSTASEVVVGPNAGNTAGVVGNSGMASGKVITLDNVTWTIDPPINPTNAPVEIKNYVAEVNGTKYETLQAALNAASEVSGEVTVEILKDIDLTDIDWNPVTISGPGYPMVTVNGKNHTITGLTDMLFAATWAGNSGLVINDLTIKDSFIVNDADDAQGAVGVGAFIGYPQASATISLNNCHLVDSHVEGGHWTGGLIGMAGGYNGNDGPVFMNLTISNCSVTGSNITGKGSVGGIIGHGSCAAWTQVTITDCEVSNNTTTSTGSSMNKAGSIMGTIGAAGQPTMANGTTKTGGVSIRATTSGNTVTSNGTTVTTVYGRQGTETGVLVMFAGGSYEAKPIEDDVTYAKAEDGYSVIEKDDGTWTIAKVSSVAFDVIPKNANISVKDVNGNLIEPEFEGTYRLVDGKYTYTVSLDGYTTKTGSFTVNGADQTLTIDLSVTVYYTVIYTDGVDDEVIFEDQRHSVEEGTATPTFAGTPARDSYTFIGWTPAVSETVTADAIYTAVWQANSGSPELDPDTGFDYDAWYWALMMLYNQQFDVSASATEGGAISPAGISKVKYDKNITYTITPDEGYSIADVLVNGESVGAVSEYTIKRIKKDQTIHAIFVKTAWENPYTDVSDEAWYYEDVEFVSENGLMIGTGDNKFSPSTIVNRAMLVTVLWRLEGSPVVDSPVDFYDVPADEWYTAAVNWAAANGIVNGYGDGIFGAMNDLTHEQIMAILNRYAVYKKWSENVSGNADDSYTNSEWAENNVLWADLYGMFDGIDSDISDLTEGADRAELAAYLRRFCERFMAE